MIILGSLCALAVDCLPKPILLVLREIVACDLAALPANGDAKHDLTSIKGAFFLVQETTTQPLKETKAEVHERLIDIHIVLKGKERLGFSLQRDQKPMEDHLAEKDYALHPAPTGEQFIDLSGGDFVIFPTGLYHRPKLHNEDGPQFLRKIVVKIPKEGIANG